MQKIYKPKTVKDLITPDYIFESSWEVCNKVGGIYTVLSTRAKTLQCDLKDKVFFIGPDLWKGKENPLFEESETMFQAWVKNAVDNENLKIRTGRWKIPGSPVVFLVDFSDFFSIKNEIYADAWTYFGVDSLHAYGDYDEASMFSYAAGKVVESFYKFYLSEGNYNVVYQAHEWMTGLGALFLKREVPEIATIFTTHATTIGRSIAGNGKPLYDYLFAYNGDQMARELNVESKHSIEKQTAHNVDCFTTVSDITDKECEQLLERKADVVLPNGFEDDFVPAGSKYYYERRKARKLLLDVAGKLTGCQLREDTLLLSIGGRYEFKNKGIDAFIESMVKLNKSASLDRDVVAFMFVPAWVWGKRDDLKERVQSGETSDQPLDQPYITHWLYNMNEDAALGMFRHLGVENKAEDRVKLIFVPCYLDGKDGIFNKTYYDLLVGMDLNIYPSYYEPWGYTPLESVAFRVPTITTDLAGFGLWAKKENQSVSISDGVEVIHRSDYNFQEAVDAICEAVLKFASMTAGEVKTARQRAGELAGKALWSNFISYYREAYDCAFRRAAERNK